MKRKSCGCIYGIVCSCGLPIRGEERRRNTVTTLEYEQLQNVIGDYISSEVLSAPSYVKNSRKVIARIKRGISNAFNGLSRPMTEAANDYKEIVNKLWRSELTDTEVKEYLSLTTTGYVEEFNLKQLINARLPTGDKRELLDMYNALQELQPYSIEYIEANDVLKFSFEAMVYNYKEEMKKLEEQLSSGYSSEGGLKDRILTLSVPTLQKTIIYERYNEYISLERNSTSKASVKSWLDHVVKIPFGKFKEDVCKNISTSDSLCKIKKGLDEKLYGMTEVKEQLLCIFNNRIQNPQTTGMSIGMVGSPGVGKTSIAKAIAEILQLPYGQISLGGMVDSCLLDGQSEGWVGSSPGKIVKILQENNYMNGVILFDEVDKLGTTQHGREVQYSLLHITDFTQNNEFKDHYIGHNIPIDLSKMIFIYAMNTTTDIDPALLSRMPIVKIDNYKPHEKMTILMNYVHPLLLKNCGWKIGDIILPVSTAEYICNKVKQEGGIRKIKDCLTVIINKTSLLLHLPLGKRDELKLSFNIPTISKTPVVLTPEIVDVLFKDSTGGLEDSSNYLTLYN